MLLQTITFLILFLSLFFLGNKTTQGIYHTILLLTINKKIALYTLLAILLPGTIIHELSHFIVATLLFVPVGNITVIPKIEQGRVKAGSVHHADCDIIRRTLIGLAPILIGLILVYTIGVILTSQIFNFQFSIFNLFIILATCYSLLATSLTMFSSKKDLETTWFLLPLLLLIALSLYFTGFRIGFNNNLQSIMLRTLENLNLYLLITIAVDAGIFLLLKGVLGVSEKILKRKIVVS